MTPAWLRSAELARSSQEHLQRTVKYGGRRRLPSLSEMRAFLVLGRRRLGLPVGGGELWPLATRGLTLDLPWQKGHVIHQLLIHLPGGVDYKTTIRTFTVSAGPQGRGWDRGAMGISSRGFPPAQPPPLTALPARPGGSRTPGGAVQADGHRGPSGSAGICPLPHQRGR